MRHCYYLRGTYRKGAEVQRPERNPSQEYSKLVTDLKSNLKLYSRALIILSCGSKKPSLLSHKRGKSNDLTSNVTLSPSLYSKCAEKSLGTGFVAVHLLSHVQLFVTQWTAAHQASLSFTISSKFAQTHVHWVDDALQPSHPLSPPSPPALNLSQHQGLF